MVCAGFEAEGMKEEREGSCDDCWGRGLNVCFCI
jgi:hypothetical protein